MFQWIVIHDENVTIKFTAHFNEILISRYLSSAFPILY
jgi:hypothetical protein